MSNYVRLYCQLLNQSELKILSASNSPSDIILFNMNLSMSCFLILSVRLEIHKFQGNIYITIRVQMVNFQRFPIGDMGEKAIFPRPIFMSTDTLDLPSRITNSGSQEISEVYLNWSVFREFLETEVSAIFSSWWTLTRPARSPKGRLPCAGYHVTFYRSMLSSTKFVCFFFKEKSAKWSNRIQRFSIVY